MMPPQIDAVYNFEQLVAALAVPIGLAQRCVSLLKEEG